jgi:plasmid stabilization system protein ParE
MIVYWSAKAKARLKEIQRYIARNAPMCTDAVINRLLKRSAALVETPRIDRQVPEYGQENLREVLERPYRIIYLVGQDRIDILTVKHYRQRLPIHPVDL